MKISEAVMLNAINRIKSQFNVEISMIGDEKFQKFWGGSFAFHRPLNGEWRWVGQMNPNILRERGPYHWSTKGWSVVLYRKHYWSHFVTKVTSQEYWFTISFFFFSFLIEPGPCPPWGGTRVKMKYLNLQRLIARQSKFEASLFLFFTCLLHRGLS